MQSLDEKLKYNKKRGTEFSVGYVLGVKTYRGYSTKDEKGKQAIKRSIDKYSKEARNGDEFAKGIMCGYRDASNERKSSK